MPRPNEEARAALRRLLGKGPISTGELVQTLGVSAPSVHRMLLELGGDLVSAGQTRQRRHALRRWLRGTVSSLPVFAIDAQGRAGAMTTIELVQPEGSLALLDPQVWPPTEADDGWWDSLPYPLFDMRPQGYLGRLVARALAQPLHVSDNPEEWSFDDVLAYLMQYGSDSTGNLIVGEQAMQAWSRERARGLEGIPAAQVGPRYLELAEVAVGQGVPGSSAGGEFPKFTAVRELAGADTPHVIVKFSGSDDSAPVRRWSDLLVCEHLALEAMQGVGGIPVARSRIVQHGGRTFLESERFDRHGDFGRSAVITLSSVDGALVGSGVTEWPRVLRARGAGELFTPELIARGEEMFWFGRFIGNSDMHTGNLSLRPLGRNFGGAPAYDMLPMMYAPMRGGEVPAREFDPSGFPVPPAGREEAWQRMLRAALAFWEAAAEDARITEGFRQICADNAQALERWAEAWAHVPADQIVEREGRRQRG
jgi:hypothetical protein